MDRIDVLGEQYSNPITITKDLLAETYDAELQEIVKNAASDLKSPIALVSLILDHIQFFKAHVGLPESIASARGTHRDVSFCQFVVKEGKTFEVNDGPNDIRIPQHIVKEFNIHSYLGVPIKIGDDVVGSLCVLDTKKREFTQSEHKNLNKLAELVNARLKVITQKRRQAKLDLTYSVLHPALTEISSILNPIQEQIELGNSHITSIKAFLELYRYSFEDKSMYSDTVKMSHEAAERANSLIQERFNEIEMNLMDSLDCLNAMNNLVSNLTQPNLSEIVISAQELSRNATKVVGGFTLPGFLSDPKVLTKGDLAIALVSNCLLSISSELKKLKLTDGIQLDVKVENEVALLLFKAKGLDAKSFEIISAQLNMLSGDNHPTVSIYSYGESIKLEFKTLKEE